MKAHHRRPQRQNRRWWGVRDDWVFQYL
jgi:hypothetical protein